MNKCVRTKQIQLHQNLAQIHSAFHYKDQYTQVHTATRGALVPTQTIKFSHFFLSMSSNTNCK